MAGKLYKRDINAIMELVGKVRAPHKGDIERAKIAAMTCKTAKEFAAFLEIEEMVFKLWCNEYPSYRKAVLTWRDHISSKVEVAMAKRAIGFKEAIRKDVITKTGQVETLIQETYYPPDTAAGQFWLKNRSPEDWKDKSEVDVNVNANIRAWLIAAGEEVQSLPGDNAELIEGQAVFVGISEEVPSLNVDEPLNVTPIVLEQEPEQKAQANAPGYSLFND